MPSHWFYSTDGKPPVGPVSATELRAVAKAGRLQPTDLVWKEGMAQWILAGQVKGLFSTIVGRDPTCDLVLNQPMVSCQHARLLRSAQGIYLEDLGSGNGTFVNGQRIHTTVLIRPGDVISFGSFSLILGADGQLSPLRSKGTQSDMHQLDCGTGVILEARDVTVSIRARRLLQNVSLVIHPGELVGLMGVSGAGKTTLLSTLNGYVAPTEGQVLLNGQDLFRFYRDFAPIIGYVPQDDIIHRDLTVFEALYYSARLRLPQDTSDFEIETHIQAVLKDLELEGTEDVLIGSPDKRGISGGQRKRVNLAMELLTDPQVLFLDEPTSGLSSQDAEVVMRLLRALADRGMTILITIHQPSLEVFRLLDNLVLLAKDSGRDEPGRLVYYGPAFPDGIAFFNGGNDAVNTSAAPEEIFRGMAQRSATAWEGTYRTSSYYADYVVQRQQQSSEILALPVALESEPAPFLGTLRFQWRTLIRRGFTIKLRDRINSTILLLQAPVIALLIVLVFGKQVKQTVTWETWPQMSGSLGTTLFIMALAALWFGASNAVREVAGEWAIYRRERMVNLSILAYLDSKFTVLGGLAVVQCLLLLGIAFPGCGLRSSFLLLFLFLLLAAFIGITIGLLLSAAARTSEVAIALLPVVLLAMVILGGAMQPIYRMHRVTQDLSMLNPVRWCFEGIIVLESGERLRRPDHPEHPRHESSPSSREDMAESYFPRTTHRKSVGFSFTVLLLLLGLYASASPVVLRLRDLR
jgi:ABC-type multidrug transport system ATPase subunit/ABC-type multidrug transport system permease subunit